MSICSVVFINPVRRIIRGHPIARVRSQRSRPFPCVFVFTSKFLSPCVGSGAAGLRVSCGAHIKVRLLSLLGLFCCFEYFFVFFFEFSPYAPLCGQLKSHLASPDDSLARSCRGCGRQLRIHNNRAGARNGARNETNKNKRMGASINRSSFIKVFLVARRPVVQVHRSLCDYLSFLMAAQCVHHSSSPRPFGVSTRTKRNARVVSKSKNENKTNKKNNR